MLLKSVLTFWKEFPHILHGEHPVLLKHSVLGGGEDVDIYICTVFTTTLRKGEKSYIFGSLQYQSVGVLLQIPLNTQAWSRRQVQNQKVNWGGRKKRPDLKTEYSCIELLSEVILLWAKQQLQKAQQTTILPESGYKTSKALDARQLLCVVNLLNSVFVSVSSVKYHNKAVVQRTELYTKKNTVSNLKEYTPETSGL